MRFRRTILVASGAIVGGVGVAWLTQSARLAEPVPYEAPPTAGHAPDTTASWRSERTPRTPGPADVAAASSSTEGASVPFQRDPRKPGYDAAKLFKIMGNDVIGLFTLEPRDEVWAQEREGDLRSLALADFRDADRDAEIEVECHTATCRVRIHSRKSYLTDTMDAYPLGCRANTSVPIWGPEGSEVEDPYSDVYLIFGQETRSRDGMLARTKTCAKYRDEWRKEALR